MAAISEALTIAVGHHQAGRLDAAEQIYRQILAIEPNQADAWNLLGVANFQRGNHQIALEYIGRAIVLDGRAASFHSNLGNVFHALLKWDDAVTCYRRALELKPAYVEAHNNLGNTLRELGRWIEAAACYQRALELKPDHAELHYCLGTILQELGRWDDAITCYRRAVELKGDYAEAHNNLGNALQEQGKHDKAIPCYRVALKLKPAYPEAYNNLGNALQEQGNPEEAVACYQQALNLKPDFAEAHNNIGNISRKQGENDRAIACYRRALDLKPDFAEAHNNLGIALHEDAKWDEALGCYRRALELKPDYAEAHHNLGCVLRELGKPDEAAVCCRRALELKPDYAEAHNNLGCVLRELGRPDEAAVCCRRALELKPDYADAHNNLGNALREQGKQDEAVAYYRRALKLNPDFAEAHSNLGTVLREQGKQDEAVSCYRRALELQPNSSDAHYNLGIVEQERERPDEAAACYRRALELNPVYAEAHNNLGNVMREQGKPDEAFACYRRALELKPDYVIALGALVHGLQQLCNWDNLHELSERLIETVEKESDSSNQTPVTPFSYMALPTVVTAQQQLRCAREWVKRKLKVPEVVAGDRAHSPAAPKSRLTIGYLSADFHYHATAMLVAELFERHDRNRFSTFGYSYGPDDGSPMRKRVVNALDRFADLKNTSFQEAAQRIAADEVDILVDLKGYTKDSRPRILAHRPAPIQVNYLGYPGTMGASFMDYILVDEFIVPPEQQPFFTEKLVHLPGCYQVNDSQREISPRAPSRVECGLPEEGFVFCSFNNNYKITPDVFGVWMKLLKAVPGSVLWLLESNPLVPSNLRREAHARGIAENRLVFAPFVNLADHLARHRLADLFLDTFPVNAHTTASEALWAGCPLLTMAGQTFVSRVAGSLLRSLGLPELVTTSLPEYEALALRLAQDGKQLAGMRARLQTNRTTSALFDGGQFAKSLEMAYQTMWEIYTAGEQPRTFRIETK